MIFDYNFGKIVDQFSRLFHRHMPREFCTWNRKDFDLTLNVLLRYPVKVKSCNIATDFAGTFASELILSNSQIWIIMTKRSGKLYSSELEWSVVTAGPISYGMSAPM